MKHSHRWSLVSLLAGTVLLAIALLASGAEAQGPAATPTPRPADAVASPEELAAAYAAWELSKHAETYDGGLGADTTCARCKSPMNWDPNNQAAEAALDCASCKRVPGEERPLLEGGVPVAVEDWQHIGCPICHEPVGDSYRVAASYWNQALGVYEPVESTSELCAHCHEGQHGFMVTEEMSVDRAHSGFECMECHNPHGDNVACVDCHDDLYSGRGAVAHANHQDNVACSGCHDRGGLALWFDRNPDSYFFGRVVTIRFAHTLTSWPSHNLQTTVKCGRCHHSAGTRYPALAQDVACDNAVCHPQGASLFWCIKFGRGVQ